jgi:hypothetical protein
MAARKKTKVTDVDFVCIGCGKIFFLNIATRCTLGRAYTFHERLFHSPECRTAWSDRQQSDLRV